MTATVRAPSGDRTVARPGRPGRRLGRNAHRALLTAHVLSAVGWFGIAVAVAGGLVLTARTEDAVLGDALVDVLRTSLWLSVPAGFALSMYLVPALRDYLNNEFVSAAEAAKEWLADSSGTNSSRVRPTPSDLHGTNRDEGAGTNGGTNSGTFGIGAVKTISTGSEGSEIERARVGRIAMAMKKTTCAITLAITSFRMRVPP